MMATIGPPDEGDLVVWRRAFDIAKCIRDALSKPENARSLSRALAHLQDRVAFSVETILVLRSRPNPQRHEKDSATILRSIIDAVFQGLYILRDKGQAEKRAELFLLFEDVERGELFKRLKRHSSLPFVQQVLAAGTEKQLEGIEGRYERAKSHFPKSLKNGKPKGVRDHWYRGNLRDLAKQIGYEDEYDIVQWEMSGAVHSSAMRGKFGQPHTVPHFPIFAFQFAMRLCKAIAEQYEVKMSTEEDWQILEMLQRSTLRQKEEVAMSKLAEAYDRLIGWTKSLDRAARDAREEIEDTVAGKRELPPNAPSRGSALLVFGSVTKKLREVNAAVAEVNAAVAEVKAAIGDEGS